MTFRYENAPVLENITFNLLPGQILALIGPNGAGKSTLLKCINGLLRPRRGSIDLNGRAINKMHPKEIARRIAYVPQTDGFVFPFKVIDVVLQGRYPHRNGFSDDRDLEKAFKALWLMGAEDLAMKDFGEISGGQQQKVTIARAIAQEAKVLLLDEPTSNLDIMHQLEVMELLHCLIKKNNMSAIISMHDLNLASRYTDEIIMLEKGKIVALGKASSVLTPENIASVYRVEVSIKNIKNMPYIVPLKPLANNHLCQKIEN